jgi:hypothetical protein
VTMAEVDAVNPTSRYRPIGQEPRKDGRKPRRKEPAPEPSDEITDDAGEGHDEPPLVDDYA